MKIKLSLFLAALLAASTLGAQTIDIDATVERALEQADIPATVEQALEQADIENTVRDAVENAMSLVRIEQQNDTVIVSAGKHRVVVVERNDDGSRTEVAYFHEKKQPSGPTFSDSYRVSRRVSGSMMVDLGLSIYDPRNIFTGEDGGDEFAPQHTGKSVGIAIYPLMGHLRLNRANTLYLSSGLGLDMANYRFEDDYILRNVDGVTTPVKFPDPLASFGTAVVPLDKSKLTTTYINIPLTLGVRIPVDRSSHRGIRLEAGVIGSIKLGAHTKWKYAAGGKDKERGSFNLNTARYQLTARAGYGSLMVFFNYQMNPMFRSGHGAELYPYQVGLSFRFGSLSY